MPVGQEKEKSIAEKREIALKRAAELKSQIKPYLQAREKIPDGFSKWEEIQKRQAAIKKFFQADENEWQDWHWQLKHRITESETLVKILHLSQEEAAIIDKVGAKYRWASSPYYLSLIDPDDSCCPVKKMCIPSKEEILDENGKEDPMAEEYTSPAPAVTRRYPDRLIIKVTNQCAMYCRHCQRRRLIGEVDRVTPRRQLEQALEYVKKNEEIRDVLLTGGDALMLNNDLLDWLLTELDKIGHVEIKRLGTRTLVTMPMRITDALCRVLEKHWPLYINTHFNHPLEITPAVKEAARKLTRTGVALGNQAVLLAGINNDEHVMKKLNQMLLKCMIRPYYLFHAKAVKGTNHFRTRVEEGIYLMEKLRGYTSGLAIPTYIVNAPDGYGKTPLLPQYLVSSSADKVVLRTWENRIIEYRNDEDIQ
ncbi:MAG: glutamate 2,3-aminomutase [Firmicutes bacterium]|nr:glutamate 2,3-aminomutase [Bacillota bacterium]